MSETLKNKQGFPLTRCGRCAGSGQYGPASVNNGRCFGCGGSGYVIKGRKALEQFAALTKAQQAHWHPTAADLQVGDRVRVQKSDDLRTIAALRWEYLGGSDGSSTQGVEGSANYIAKSHLSIRVYIIWEGGAITVVNGARSLMASRAGRVDPAPYLAAAGIQ